MSKEEAIFEKEEDQEDVLNSEEIKVEYKIYETTVRDLWFLYKEGDLNERPKYQRGYVWTVNQASEFIESVILGLPIPGIILVKMDGYKSEILDGQQRLSTLFRFLEGEKLPEKSREFRLKKLSILKKLNNKNFKEIKEYDENLSKIILRTKIPVTDIDFNKTTKKAIYHTFARINTGGTKLSSQNIRNAIYKSKFLNELSKDIDESNVSNLFNFSAKQIAEGKEMEIILRIMTIYFGLKDNISLEGSITNMINSFTERAAFVKTESGNKFSNFNYQDLIKETQVKILNILSSLPNTDIFKNNNKISIMKIESIMVALLLEKIELNKILIESLTNGIEIDLSAKSFWFNQTNNINKIKGRVNQVISVIHGTNNA